MYKIQPHSRLATLLKGKYGSLFKATLTLEMKYDRLISITRGRTRPSVSEVDMISSLLKKTPRDVGFSKMGKGGLEPPKAEAV